MTAWGGMVGPAIAYHTNGTWPITVRLAAGILFGAAYDTRAGTYTTSGGAAYPVKVRDVLPLLDAYAAPEVRIGRRIGRRFELSLGLSATIALGLLVPRWNASRVVNTLGDGLATFPNEAVLPPIFAWITPNVGARVDL